MGSTSKRLRIAHLATVDMSLALLLATELEVDVAAGHEVIGISAAGPYVDAVEALGVRHVPLPSLSRSWGLRSDQRAARELWRTLGKLQLDVLHTHTPKAGVLGRVLGRLARVPVVVNTCHGLWAGPDDSWPKRVLVVGVEGVASRFSHAELFQNEVDRRRLRWAVDDRKATVVGNGVDLARFRFDPSGRARVRAEWGVGDDEVLVGGVGRRVAEKGIVELAEAAALLHDRARYVCVGPRDDAKSDRISVTLGGLRLVDERTDMPGVYSALDVFVLPSHREGFSRSAMEAAACGRASVLSDIRGCREIGDHRQHLMLVPPRDPGRLAAAIRILVEDPTLRERLGAAAATRAHGAFDQRRVAHRSLETYAAVAERRGLGWT